MARPGPFRGCPWPVASATLGLPQVCNTFARWRQRGVRDVLLALLRQQARAKAGRQAGQATLRTVFCAAA